MKANSSKIQVLSFCIVFDGKCPLCSSFLRLVDMSIRAIAPVYVTSSPLSSPISAMYNKLDLETLNSLASNSILVISNDFPVKSKSEAILFICKNCTGLWANSLSIFLRICPPQISDFFYDLVASVRRNIVFPVTTCSTGFTRLIAL